MPCVHYKQKIFKLPRTGRNIEFSRIILRFQRMGRGQRWVDFPLRKTNKKR